jgi:hypothetical protein
LAAPGSFAIGAFFYVRESIIAHFKDIGANLFTQTAANTLIRVN